MANLGISGDIISGLLLDIRSYLYIIYIYIHMVYYKLSQVILYIYIWFIITSCGLDNPLVIPETSLEDGMCHEEILWMSHVKPVCCVWIGLKNMG